MKKIIIAATLFAAASSAFASIPVSATAEASEVVSGVSSRTAAVDPKDNHRPAPSLNDVCPGCVSATATAQGDISAPYVAAMGVPISAPQAQDEGEGSVALAGLGFGLVGLIGVAKVARRKKQKGTETL